MLTRTLLLTLLCCSFSHAEWGTPVLDTLSTNSSTRTTGEMMAVDHSGKLHIIYLQQRDDTVGNYVIYRTNSPDGSWQPPITVNPEPSAFAYSAALAVSPVTATPFVVFCRDDYLALGMLNGTEWLNQPIFQGDPNDPLFTACCPTIDLDLYGVPNLAWISYDIQQDVYHIAYYPVVWSEDIQILEGSELGPFGSGGAPSIAVDDLRRAHITYRGGDFGNYRVHYAHNNAWLGHTWTYNTLFTANLEDFSSDLHHVQGTGLIAAISGNDGFGFPGRAHLMFGDENDNWTPADLVSDQESVTAAVVSTDAAGTAHVLSMQVSGNILTGHLIASEWDFENEEWTVEDILEDAASEPSLVVDQSGYGHLLYTIDSAGGHLLIHARSETPLTNATVAWEFSPADTLDFPPTPVGQSSQATLFITNTGTAPVHIYSWEEFGPFTTNVLTPQVILPEDVYPLTVTFSPPSEGEFIESIEVLSADPDLLHVAVCRGSTTLDTPVRTQVARDFALSVSPNPFNPSTRITLELASAARVQLFVSNILGERIAAIADDDFPAGTHTLRFDAAKSNLTSGLYLIHAQSETLHRTVKAVLLK